MKECWVNPGALNVPLPSRSRKTISVQWNFFKGINMFGYFVLTWPTVKVGPNLSVFMRVLRLPKKETLTSQSHSYSNGLSVSQSLFKDKTLESLRTWQTKLVELLLQNNKDFNIPYVAGVSEKLKMLLIKHHLAVCFRQRLRLVHPKGQRRRQKQSSAVYAVQCREKCTGLRVRKNK